VAHPSEYYIRFLILNGHTDPKDGLTHINKTLSHYCSPDLSEEQFREIRDDFVIPDGLVLSSKKDRKTKEFMDQQELTPLWIPDDNVKRVLLLCRTPMVIEMIQMLLFGRVPHDIIADRVSCKQELTPPLAVRDIDLYRHFFWNYTLCSTSEWESYLYHFGSRGDHLLAGLRCGKLQALWRAGYEPKVDGKRAIRDASRHLYFRMDASRMMPDTKETIEILTKLTKELTSVHAALSGEGAHLEEILREFRNLNMTTVAPGIQSLSDIASGGDFSNSGKK